MSTLQIRCFTFKYTAPSGQVTCWPVLNTDNYFGAYREFLQLLKRQYVSIVIAKIEIKLPGEPLVTWQEFKKSLEETEQNEILH